MHDITMRVDDVCFDFYFAFFVIRDYQFQYLFCLPVFGIFSTYIVNIWIFQVVASKVLKIVASFMIFPLLVTQNKFEQIRI